MRVMVLSQYYAPEPIPKPVELAEELAKRGHQVAVLTGFPNYPTGRLYPGYRLAPFRRETVNGIRVIRTYEYPYHGKNAAGRALNYLSFMVSAALGALLIPASDVIYVWHPPLSIGVAAWVISGIRRIPFVYDVQDIWPESALASGILNAGRIAKIMSMLERFIYRKAKHVLVVTDGGRRNLIRKGVPPEMVSVLPHWVDETLFAEVAAGARSRVRERFGWTDRFVALFAGNLGTVQGLDTVVEAASRLERDSKALIVLVGDGSERTRLHEAAKRLRIEQSLQFIDQQPRENMAELFAAADTLLVHLRRSEIADYVIPTKTFAYLAAGRPILMAMEGAGAKLVKEAQAGIVVPPENPAELVRGIHMLMEMPAADQMAMGQRGQEYLRARFSKERVLPQYERILRLAVSSGND